MPNNNWGNYLPPNTLSELREYVQCDTDWDRSGCLPHWDALDREAQALGYRDASHACEFYRTLQGVTPGSRVIAFDSRLFVDDINTPLSHTKRIGTVVCRYGKQTEFGRYFDLVDIQFDRCPDQISHGHFTCGVEPIIGPLAQLG